MPSGVTGTCRPSSIFSASSRAVISSRPLPVTISRSQPARVRAASAKRGAEVERALDHARAGRLVGGAGDRGEGQQRRDVADGVAPRGVDAAAWRSTMSAPVSASGLAVIRIVRALGGRAWRRASPPCRPRGRRRSARRSSCGSSEASNASRARAPSSAAPAIAACSLVPQPMTTTGPPSRIHSAASSASAEARIGATSPGSAQIISSIAHGGPSRSSGIVAHGRRRYRLSGPSDRATSMPMNRATLELFAALDRSAPEPLRAQLEDAICAAITGGGAPPGTRLPASRTLAEALARLPRRGQRGVRPDRRRGLDRGPPRQPPRSSAPPHAAHQRGQTLLMLARRGFGHGPCIACREV